MSGELSDRMSGLEMLGRLLLRIMWERRTRSSTSCPASGAAVMTVLRDGLGAGEGLVVRKRGWMWSSQQEDWRDSGREPGRGELFWRVMGMMMVGLFARELPLLVGVPGGKAVISFRPSPAGFGEVGDELLGGGVMAAAGNTLVKFGTMGEPDGGDPGRETDG